MAQYPNLIHLYGHDHGKDSAYVREATEQRVTQYDTDGNKMFKEETSPLWKMVKDGDNYQIQNAKTGKYLGFDENMGFLETPTECVIEKVGSTGNTYRISIPSAGKLKNLFFSDNTKTFSGSEQTCEMEIYRQVDEEDGVHTLERAEDLWDDEVYVIARKASDQLYALTNQTNGCPGHARRLLPADIRAEGEALVYEEPSKEATPSFLTSFVGSMRFYESSIDGRSSPDDSKVVQAMMVYVYKDRVELQMKNYGTYEYYDEPFPGNPSIVIHKNLLPFITYRKVYNNKAYLVDLEEMVEQMERVSLAGYTQESVRMFQNALDEAKKTLKTDLDSDAQGYVDWILERLVKAKNNLKPAENQETKPPVNQETEPPVNNVVKPKLQKPILKASLMKKGKVKLSWKKQKEASGYQLQMKAPGKGFKNFSKVTKNTKIKLTTKKLKKGTYKFRMRSYAVYKDKKNKKQTAWSKYSKAVTVKVKKF